MVKTYAVIILPTYCIYTVLAHKFHRLINGSHWCSTNIIHRMANANAMISCQNTMINKLKSIILKMIYFHSNTIIYIFSNFYINPIAFKQKIFIQNWAIEHYITHNSGIEVALVKPNTCLFATYFFFRGRCILLHFSLCSSS